MTTIQFTGYNVCMMRKEKVKVTFKQLNDMPTIELRMMLEKFVRFVSPNLTKEDLIQHLVGEGFINLR